MRVRNFAHKIAGVVTLILFVSFANSSNGQLFQDDLNTAGSAANWTVVQDTDSAATFAFDYSALGIPSAPNGTGTVGVKLEANNAAPGERNDIGLVHFDNDFTGQFTFQVDIWANWALDPNTFTGDPNNPSIGVGQGTTEFSGAGVAHDAFVPGPFGGSLYYTGDGGSGRDYRAYRNSSEQFPESGQYAIGNVGGDNNASNPILTSAFPSIDVDAVTSSQQGSTGVIQQPGTGGFQWMTMTVEVDTVAVGPRVVNPDPNNPAPDVPGLITFSLTSAASGQTVEIVTLNNNNGNTTTVDLDTTRSIALLHGDFFSSVTVDPNFSFAVFDNVLVTEGIVQENADFDNDGNVTGLDLLIYQQNIGLTGQTDNSNGDANGDGVVGTADLAIFETQYGGAPPVGAIPEPTSAISCLLFSLCYLLGYRPCRYPLKHARA